jgi:hypothetical protein
MIQISTSIFAVKTKEWKSVGVDLMCLRQPMSLPCEAQQHSVIDPAKR